MKRLRPSPCRYVFESTEIREKFLGEPEVWIETEQDIRIVLNELIIPFVEDMTINDAKQALDAKGLTYQIVGDGETVCGQMPLSGSVVSQGGTVILYTQKNYTQENVEVPDLTGYSLSDASYLITSAGLTFVASGASTDSSSSVVQSQSVEAGNIVPKGTVLELTFGVNDQSG